jgi:hypothetical protein
MQKNDETAKLETIHRKIIKTTLDCLDNAFSPDDIRPDILGVTSNPCVMYAVEIQTTGGGFTKLRKYKKQNAIKYVIFVDLKRRGIRVISLVSEELDKLFSKEIWEVVRRLEGKFFGTCTIVWSQASDNFRCYYNFWKLLACRLH